MFRATSHIQKRLKSYASNQSDEKAVVLLMPDEMLSNLDSGEETLEGIVVEDCFTVSVQPHAVTNPDFISADAPLREFTPIIARNSLDFIPVDLGITISEYLVAPDKIQFSNSNKAWHSLIKLNENDIEYKKISIELLKLYKLLAKNTSSHSASLAALISPQKKLAQEHQKFHSANKLLDSIKSRWTVDSWDTLYNIKRFDVLEKEFVHLIKRNPNDLTILVDIINKRNGDEHQYRVNFNTTHLKYVSSILGVKGVLKMALATFSLMATGGYIGYELGTEDAMLWGGFSGGLAPILMHTFSLFAGVHWAKKYLESSRTAINESYQVLGEVASNTFNLTFEKNRLNRDIDLLKSKKTRAYEPGTVKTLTKRLSMFYDRRFLSSNPLTQNDSAFEVALENSFSRNYSNP